MNKMYKYFTYTKDLHYLNILQSIVESYNNKPHRSLNWLAPNKVTKSNEKKVWELLYGDYIRNNHPKFKFSIGENVRISGVHRVFHKGYKPTFSSEIFTISDVKATNPPTYHLMDKDSQILRGSFYHTELQKTRK